MQRAIRSALILFALFALVAFGAVGAVAQTTASDETVKLGLIDIYSGGFAFIDAPEGYEVELIEMPKTKELA